MREIMADYIPAAGASAVNAKFDVTTGNFRLNSGVDPNIVEDWLDKALVYAKDTTSAAGFLIPVSCTGDT
jgi:hypothetical protein